MSAAMEPIWIGRNVWQSGEPETPHQHDGNEWNLLIEGHAQRMIGGEVFSCPRGSLIYLPVGCVHSMVKTSSRLRLWAIWDRSGPAESGRGVRGLSDEHMSEIGTLCRLLKKYKREEAAESVTRQLALSLRNLLSHRWSAAEDQVDGATIHPAVQHAIDLLHATGGIMSLDSLAHEVGLSRSRLSHLFTEQMEQSLHTYRNRARLQAFDAARRAEPERDLASLAEKVGFTNYMQCYRAHCRIRGVPPSVSGLIDS